MLLAALVVLACPAAHSQPAKTPTATADVYDGLREKWKTMLTGGDVEAARPDYVDKIKAVAKSAQEARATMVPVAERAGCKCLWKDIATETESADITKGYGRLKDMALAYQTPGTGPDYYHNAALRDVILDGLDWMHANRYYPRKQYKNWFDWEIGTPMHLNDIMVLLYDELTPARRAAWIGAIDYFSPNQAGEDGNYMYWGANRVWRVTVHAGRGIVGKTDAKMLLARDGLSDLSDGHTGKRSVFKYVTESDGFYADGSYIQHFGHAYTGGYGKALLSGVADAMYMLHGTPWQVTDPDAQNVYDWVYNAYAPLIYKNGQFMDMVRGREISRHGATDTKASMTAIGAIVRLAQLAPEPHKRNFQRMVKYWIGHMSGYYKGVSINIAGLSKAIMQDPAIVPMDEPVMNKVFAGMDRVVHRRPGWGLGLAMNSTRQAYYETHTFNFENGKGWYTSEGTTYLYNGDSAHYSGNYWPTVNPHRMAGTTVDAGLVRTDQSGYSWNPLTYSTKNWVGGTSDGTFGVAGMEQDAWGATLTSRKSWFMFDDEVVVLGAGIESTDNRPIHTIVENRKLTPAGDNVLTVNGARQATPLKPEATVFPKAKWAHLAGPARNADIGYYFPDGTDIGLRRESRSAKWSAINLKNTPKGDPTFTNHFQEIWLDHGPNPKDAHFAYVLLPNKSADEVGRYAARPDITILENSAQAQAVRENRLGLLGVNFWNDAPTSVAVGKQKNYVSSTHKASVLLKETPGGLTVLVSDPTQRNEGTISLEINRPAKSVLTTDPAIKVEQLTPTIKLTVDVRQAHGKSFAVTLATTADKNKVQ